MVQSFILVVFCASKYTNIIIAESRRQPQKERALNSTAHSSMIMFILMKQ
jgi:hypothetical protein